jgi:adenylylsulfate kinase-like enzyme
MIQDTKLRLQLQFLSRVVRKQCIHLAGISAPYQAPLTPDVVVDTDQIGIEESVMAVLALLHQRGVIERNPSVHAL